MVVGITGLNKKNLKMKQRRSLPPKEIARGNLRKLRVRFEGAPVGRCVCVCVRVCVCVCVCVYVCVC